MKTTKLICIETYLDQLVINEIYDGRIDNITTTPTTYDSINNETGWYVKEKGTNLMGWFPERCFMLLSEWRDKQIDSILEN